MFKARVLTAVIGIPVLLGILYLGGIYWKILFALMGIVAFRICPHDVQCPTKTFIGNGLLLLVLLLLPLIYIYISEYSVY